MNINTKLYATFLLKKHEGLRLEPYHCTAGKLTIGYGHNLDDNGISPALAEQLLVSDIDNITSELEQQYWFGCLSALRQAVIVDMGFNLGLSRFLQFKKMIAALIAQDFALAADEMLDSKWAKQVGSRATTLAFIMCNNMRNNIW